LVIKIKAIYVIHKLNVSCNTVYLVKNTKSKKAAGDKKKPDQKNKKTDQKDKKPSQKDKTAHGVKTGDESPVEAWLVMMAISLSALAAMVFRRKKNR
jgi:LPXTG-motif cell wall-anchored protein